MSAVCIAVQGIGKLTHAAERAEVRLSVGVDGSERARVVARATRIHNQVAAEAADLVAAGTAERWSAEDVYASSDREWVGEGLPRREVHRAHSWIEVRFRDLAALPAWVSRWWARPFLSVSSIDWALTRETRERVREEARGQAVRSAIARARTYARAAGAGEARIVAIYEPGLRRGGGGRESEGSQLMAPMMPGSAPGSDEDQLQVKPRDIAVTALISADFEA